MAIQATRLLRAAACHVSPVFLSAQKTTDKCISLIKQAASNQANLVVFPETYIPAFPVWSAIRAPIENHDLFKRMVKESIYVDGEEIDAIRAAAKQSGVFVSLGISEKARFSSGTLWNSNLILGPDGEVLNHHRKLVATFFEKLTWSHGDGHGLKVVDTPFGKLGSLICGENTNPLARYSLMAQGEQIHISSWPAIWPTRKLSSESSTNSKNYDNVAANRTRAAAHCFEAKAFGIVNSGFLGDEAFQIIQEGASDSEGVLKTLRASPRAATMFLDPTGTTIPGYTIDSVTGQKTTKEYLQDEEGILYAEMNVEDCVEGKQYHDIVGGYQRLDIFDVKIDRSRRHPAQFVRSPAVREQDDHREHNPEKQQLKSALSDDSS
ncbi:carbon-nitrogen hydrolase [Lecanosticta acicola]|uniref:Carbon-nitrogen hydrolase n=1 Tax=Lecanosticta acicola TaxID=111012 RepID=A0AAI8YY16_9PEZI|nr:carbon-nitrogen hydrolase [Lecanosticta acicola]